jgi:hypothetical protein
VRVQRYFCFVTVCLSLRGYASRRSVLCLAFTSDGLHWNETLRIFNVLVEKRGKRKEEKEPQKSLQKECMLFAVALSKGRNRDRDASTVKLTTGSEQDVFCQRTALSFKILQTVQWNREILIETHWSCIYAFYAFYAWWDYHRTVANKETGEQRVSVSQRQSH